MTNPNLTAIALLVDKSGSMGGLENDTIGGVNAFINSQKEGDGEAKVSVITFNGSIDYDIDYADISEYQDFTRDNYRAAGGTALTDAIGSVITSLGMKFAQMPEEERPGNVIIAVMTDGEDTASREYSPDKISEMIKHQTEKYEWEFIFLGADQDAITAGSYLGFGMGKSVNFSKGKVGATMTHLGGKIKGYRTATSRGATKYAASLEMDYSQEDRDEVS